MNWARQRNLQTRIMLLEKIRIDGIKILVNVERICD